VTKWENSKGEIVKNMYLANGPEVIARCCKVPESDVVYEAIQQGLEKDMNTVIKYCGIRNIHPKVRAEYPGAELVVIPAMAGIGCYLVKVVGSEKTILMFNIDVESVLDLRTDEEKVTEQAVLGTETVSEGDKKGTNPAPAGTAGIITDIHILGTQKRENIMSPAEEKPLQNIEEKKDSSTNTKKGTKSMPYSKLELEDLKVKYQILTKEELEIDFPGRTYQALEKKAKRMHLRKRSILKPGQTDSFSGAADILTAELGKIINSEGVNLQEMLNNGLDTRKAMNTIGVSAIKILIERLQLQKNGGNVNTNEIVRLLDIISEILNRLLSKKHFFDENDRRTKLEIEKKARYIDRETKRYLTPAEKAVMITLQKKAKLRMFNKEDDTDTNGR